MADPNDWEDVEDWEEVQAVPPAQQSAASAPTSTPADRLRAAAKDPGLLRSIGSNLLQGFYKGGSDEAAAALGAFHTGTPLPGAVWRETGEPLKTRGDVYRALRDSERRTLEGAREHHPVTSFLSQMAGDVGSDFVANLMGVPGVGSTPYNVLTGGLSGFLGSDAELTPAKATKGSAAEALLGTGIGAGLGYIAPKIGQGIGRFRQAIANRAGRGVQAAENLAEAIATKDVNKTLNSLRGEAGGAASRASNALSNIEDIPLPETPARTMGALKETLRGQAAALEERIAAVRAQAAAAGVNPDDLANLKTGEFLSKGSKLDKAQQMAKKVGAYEETLQKIQGYLEDIKFAPDENPALDPYEALRAARAKVRQDPALIDAQANILKNSMEDVGQAVDESAAARLAFKTAQEGKGEEIAKRTEQLLSPKAATARLKALGIRYGLPALGGYLGSQLGGVEGAAVGLAAGAGARPGLQAILRAGREPGVQRLAWRGLQAAADPAWLQYALEKDPELFSRLGASTGRQAAPSMADALIEALRSQNGAQQ